MLTIIKASLLGSALMLLQGCTGYLTNYQTPCVPGHVCQCVQHITVYRAWLDCRGAHRLRFFRLRCRPSVGPRHAGIAHAVCGVVFRLVSRSSGRS